MSRQKKERLKKGNLFIPLLFSVGAPMVDSPLDQYLRDPTKISNALRMFQGHFKLDGLLTYGDPTFMAEALGCECKGEGYPPQVKPLAALPDDLEKRLSALPAAGRVATAIEVTKRLNMLLPDCILACVVPGPFALACQITGLDPEEVQVRADLLSLTTKGVLSVAKALGDVGVDVLLFWESAIPRLDQKTVKSIWRCYSPLWNTAKFYDLTPLMLIQHIPEDSISPLKMEIDGVVVPAVTPPGSRGQGRRLSLAIPVDLIEQEVGRIEAFFHEHQILPVEGRKVFLVTTHGEIPESIHKEHMIRGIQTVKSLLERSI